MLESEFLNITFLNDDALDVDVSKIEKLLEDKDCHVNLSND